MKAVRGAHLRLEGIPLSRPRIKDLSVLGSGGQALADQRLEFSWVKCKRRFIMPTYEFMCEKCNKLFTLILGISEYEKMKFRCPKCKSTRVKQQITSFQAVTSKKS